MKLLHVVNGSPDGLPFIPLKQNLWGAVIGGLSSVGSSALNFFGNRETNASNQLINEETRQWQSKENELAYERQKELWNMENEYSSPQAQMQRYRDAGINPFLVGGSSLQQSQSPLPSMSMSGSPSAIPMRSPQFDLDFRQLGEQLFKEDLIKSESANQTAQSISEFMKAYAEVFDKAGSDAADKFAQQFLPFLHGTISDTSYFKTRLDINNRALSAEADMKRLDADLLQKYGNDLNYEKLHKLREESTNLIHQRGVLTALGNLYNGLESKSRAEIKRIVDGELPNLINAAYEKFQHSKLLEKMNMNEADKREFFYDMLRMEFAAKSMEFVDSYADYQENEYVRSWKQSHEGKVTRSWNYTNENNPVLNTYDRVMDSAGRTLSVFKPFSDNNVPQMPWQTKYRKVIHKKPTYSGSVVNEYYLPMTE